MPKHARIASRSPQSRPHCAARLCCTRPSAPTPTTEHSACAPLRIVDAFAGIGGFHLGFRRAGATCVAAIERDPAARVTYQRHFEPLEPGLFSSGRFLSDITHVDASDLPEFEVLTGGFPCQAFSVAGKARGLHDERGVLFFELARLLTACRPAAFVFENVPGLAWHNGGTTLAAMQQVLTTTLGYTVHTRVLRACDYGLPQLRPRLFMVGFRDPDVPFRFPPPVPLTTSLSDVLGGHCERELSRTVLTTGMHRRHGQKYNWAHYIVDGVERRITPREAATLQGFPPYFTLPERDAAAYRLVGNAVAVPVVAAIAGQVTASLSGSPEPAAAPTGDIG